MKKKYILFLTAFLTAWLGAANTAKADVTDADFWRANAAADYGTGQLDENAKTLVIMTAAELAKFSNNSGNNGFEGWTVTLGADIDLSARYWQPICANNVPFLGTFNGNGHKVTGLKIDARLITTDSRTDPARLRHNAFGLFGWVAGMVQNLTVEDCNIYLQQTAVSTQGNKVGAIAGELQAGGTIVNCRVDGGTVHGVKYVGGIVGRAVSSGDLATIVGCNSSASVDGHNYLGGIAGQLTGNASINSSLYTGSSVAGPSYIGWLVGDMSDATEETQNTYYTNGLAGKNSFDRQSYAVSCSTAGLALDFGPGQDYSQSGITAYESVLKYGGTYFAGADEVVTFGFDITDNTKTYINNVLVYGQRADRSGDNYSFTMQAQNTVVTADLLDDNSWDQAPFRAESFSVIDQDNKTITIIKPSELGLLAYNVNSGINDYSEWTIEIGNKSEHSGEEFDYDNSLSLGGHGWVPIGTQSHPFRGTFNGNGHGIRSLVIADTRWASDYSGLFGYVSDGTIQSLKLYGCMVGGANYVGAIAGAMWSGKIEDCYVDESCVVSASGEYVGGLVGNTTGICEIYGNFCAAPVAGVKRVGGLVGQVASALAKDNFYGGVDDYVSASGTAGNGMVSYVFGNINTSSNNGERMRNYSAATLIKKKINDHDHAAYSITSGNSEMTISVAATQVKEYATSGITSYEGSNYLKVDDKVYAEEGVLLELTLSLTNGGDIKNVTTTSGTLTVNENDDNLYTLVLPAARNAGVELDADVVINATKSVFWSSQGIRADAFSSIDTVNHTITITSAAELGLLAYNVNSGNCPDNDPGYQGWTITLGDNINLTHAEAHWMPIGNSAQPFKGIFNGNGKEITNMTIAAGDVDSYVGLFGFAQGYANSWCVIRGVKMDSCSVEGVNCVGSIAGKLSHFCRVEDCYVGSGVAVSGTDRVGGMVGLAAPSDAAQYRCIVRGCVSAAAVTGQNNVGGLVGEADACQVQCCVYTGGSVTGVSGVGAVIGNNVYAMRDANFFTNAALIGKNGFDRYAYSIAGGTDGMTLSLNSTDADHSFATGGVTFYRISGEVYGSFKLNGLLYGGNNQTVSITVGGLASQTWAIKANGDGSLLRKDGTGTNWTDADGTGTFTLTVDGADYVLTANSTADDFEGEGREDFPYLIKSISDMTKLATVVNDGTANYQDRFFRLVNDLTYTGTDIYTPIGTSANPFKGSFDGDGKTISGINYASTQGSGYEYLGVFGYIEYGEVSHLKLDNCSFAGSTNGATSYVGGIAGYCKSNRATSMNEATTILDCLVTASVALSGSYVGGIAGWTGDIDENYHRANVEGCISAASVSATQCAGGVIGWMRGTGLQVKNCLYTGGDVTVGAGADTYMAYGVGNYNSSGISSLDIYYSRPELNSPNSADRKAYSVTLANPATVTNGSGGTTNLTLTHVAPTVSYSLTGIQGYTVGLTVTDGSSVTYYATQGQTVTFTLTAENEGSISAVTATPDGGEAQNVALADGNYSFAINVAKNYTVSAEVSIEWEGTGTETDPYLIRNVAQLNLLAANVNAGKDYGIRNFKVVADIDYTDEPVTDGRNFTPIGNYHNRFKGVFDGNGHTIKGIKINSDNQYVGFFGFLSANASESIINLPINGIVKNVTLEDISVTSTYALGNDYACVGALVGFASGELSSRISTIENCHVTGTSAVTGNNCAGGLVGTLWRGKVYGCTTNATVSAANASPAMVAGGLIGNTRGSATIDIKDCLYLGTGVTGAIKGYGIGLLQFTSSYNSENVFYPSTLDETNANANDVKGYAYDEASTTYSGTEKTQYANKGITVYEEEGLLKYNGNYYSRYQKGDANGDGYINITDYVTIVNKIHDAVSGKFNLFTGDANSDGFINITDAVKVVNFIHNVQ